MPAWFEEVATRLAARPVVRISDAAGLRRAAVLVPLFVKQGEIWVVLTLRSDSMVQHASQDSFPGGAREEGDEDEVATALRESHEELGIEPEAVMVLGHLDEVRTPSGFAIAPVVGALPAGLDLASQSSEVEAVVEVPLLFLANPDLIEEQEIVYDAMRITSPIFHYRGHRIWGATARILADLLARLGLMDG